MDHSNQSSACISSDALLADAPTPLETLIDRLQGSASSTLADSGIAGFDRDSLDRIAGCAERERGSCERRMRCLLELLDAAMAGDRANLPDSLLLATVQQVLRLLRDARRWHELSDNAAYYRDHPEVAVRIAGREAGTASVARASEAHPGNRRDM